VNTLAGVLILVAFMPYIWAIISGQTVPSPVSWAIWASVDTLTLVAMKKEKAAVGQLSGAVAGAWIVMVLAVVYGVPKIGYVEWVSIAGAVTGIVLWHKTGNPILAIICTQVALLVGAAPTFHKAYLNPFEEDPLAWTIWEISCICAIKAIPKWNLANALQPLTFLTIDTTVYVLVVIRPLWFV